MTALERIKDIEENKFEGGERYDGHACDHVQEVNLMRGDIPFLIKAFKVMRKIAMECYQDSKVRYDKENITVPIWESVERPVDEEFEERMSAKE